MSSQSKTKLDWKLLLPSLLGLGLYLLAVNHGFVLDDNLVLTQNVHVHEGFGGIGDILSTNYAHGHQGFNDGLYRPMSLVSFAIEKSLFNLNPAVSHFIQALLYAILLLGLALWLRVLMKGDNLNWMWMTLIFAAHPIHTEVVANLKSRDEILALLFFGFAAYHFTTYLLNQRMTNLIWASLLFLLSLFSKESAITYLAIFPLIYWLVKGGNITESLKGSWLLAIPAVLFLAIRTLVLSGMGEVDSGVRSLLQNALISNDGVLERILTGAQIQALYITKLFMPVNLSHDYSYNAIPVSGATVIGAWIWVLGLISFIALAYIGIRQRKIWAFGILFYFITVSVVSNVFILIGAMAAERFVFAPSLGWTLAVVPLIASIKQIKPNQKPFMFLLVIAGFTGLSAQRIPDWQSNFTLFEADVEKVDQSARAHYNYGTALSDQANIEPANKAELLRKSQNELQRAIEIWPEYQDAYNNLGVAFIADGKFEEAYKVYSELRRRFPEYTKGIFNLAFVQEKLGLIAEAEKNYEQYEAIVPDNNVLFVIIELEGQQGKFDEAIAHLEELISREPNKGRGYMKMAMAYAIQGEEITAEKYFLKTIEIAPRNAEAYFNLGMVYANTGRGQQAVEALNTCLDLNPNHERALNLLKQLQSSG